MAETNKNFLGNYELLQVIGDGAEGRVYRAKCMAQNLPNVSLGEAVAVKRLKSTGHEKESQHFLRQIKILSKLCHPNIVGHKDSFVWRETELEEDIYCLVMELLEGESLKALVEKTGHGLPWDRAKILLMQILQALLYASKNGVIHRDLKPSNIFITTAGSPKLVDFGIARHDDGDATATNSVAGAKGTFDYMAPDFALQHGGFRGDEQSDIFSFGVIVYYTLTGSLPFPALGEHAARGYYIRWLGQKPPVVEFRQPIFRVLSHARTCISKCIDPDRAGRFKTFAEVLGSFAQIGCRKLKHGNESYEFTDWLGKGGFGEVFRARRLSDGRDVAVKRLFTTNHSARFVREAKILHGAAHPNLTEYVDFLEVRAFNDEPEYYLILEYLEGMPGAGLSHRIKKSEAGLNPTEVLQLFTRYLDCLEHLHKNGIIHRDIKPANLYAPVNCPEKAKIFDLGIAHDEEGTRTHGQVPGTLDFMPPEFARQASGRGSAQSDIYAIGVTLYLALTKKLPFPRLAEKEDEMWVAFFQRAETPLECPFDHPVFITYPELVPLLRRAIAHDPKQRFEKAGRMRDEIAKLLAQWSKPVNQPGEDDHPTAITEVVAFAPAAKPSFNFPGRLLNQSMPAREPPDPIRPPVGSEGPVAPERAAKNNPAHHLDRNSDNGKAGPTHEGERSTQAPIGPPPAKLALPSPRGELKPPGGPSSASAQPQRVELRHADGTRLFITNQTTLRIGRHRDCDVLARLVNAAGQELRAESLLISQFHAHIEWLNHSCRLKDGGLHPQKGWQPSTAGLWVDSRRISPQGEFELAPDREHQIALSNPNNETAPTFKLTAKLWLAGQLPEKKPACQTAEVSPHTPACLVLRRVGNPGWIYFILRSSAALAWGDPRCGRACVGLRNGNLHLSEGQACEPLIPGREIRAGSLNFQVIALPSSG